MTRAQRIFAFAVGAFAIMALGNVAILNNAFPGRRKIVLVHGCFWHRHGCRNSVLPKSRREWWDEKLTRNVERDSSVVTALEALGWSVLTVWECETKSSEALAEGLRTFLGPPGSPAATHVVLRKA